jgi:hypothetical protein
VLRDNNLIIFVIGVLVLCGSTVWSFKQYGFVNKAAKASGVVISLNAGGSHPQIKFKTSEGKEIEFPQGGLIAGYKVGDQVEVLYDLADPSIASINSFFSLWGFASISFLIGLCMVAKVFF